jgi:hypothetical protein
MYRASLSPIPNSSFFDDELGHGMDTPVTVDDDNDRRVRRWREVLRHVEGDALDQERIEGERVGASRTV